MGEQLTSIVDIAHTYFLSLCGTIVGPDASHQSRRSTLCEWVRFDPRALLTPELRQAAHPEELIVSYLHRYHCTNLG